MSDPVRGDLALWSYIQSVYNQINTGRSKFSLGSNIAIPSNPGQITTSDISSIKAQINLFNNNAYVRNDSNAQAAINSITVPTRGALIRPLSLSTTMDTINNVCIHNATYRGSYNSSNCNNSYNSGGYNSSGYNSSGYNSSNCNNSYNSGGYNSSGYNSSGYNSSVCNNSYNSGGYNSSGYNSSGYNSSVCNNSYNSGGYNSSGYNSSVRSVQRTSYRSAYNSSNVSYRGTYRSSYNSSNYTYRSGYKRTR